MSKGQIAVLLDREHHNGTRENHHGTQDPSCHFVPFLASRDNAPVEPGQRGRHGSSNLRDAGAVMLIMRDDFRKLIHARRNVVEIGNPHDSEDWAQVS